MFKILSIIAVTVFVLIAAMVGFESSVGLAIKGLIASIPYCDKCVHLGMMVTLSFLLYHATQQRRVNLLGRAVLFSSMALSVGISLEELSQAFIPSRNFEIMDLLCNYAGIYLGSLLPRMPILKHLNHADRLRSEALSVQTVRHSARPMHHEGGHGWRFARRLGRRHGSR